MRSLIKIAFWGMVLLLGGSKTMAQSFTIDNYKYTILDADAKTVSIQKKTGAEASINAIVIPDEITHNAVTYRVTEVAGSGFYECCKTSSTASITIGKNVTRIGELAFYNCKFKEVVIPASVMSVGTEAFKTCTSLRKVTFDAASGLTTIGMNAFNDCRRLNTIILPPQLTALPNGLLASCDSLETITIPASVSSIHEDAFSNINPSKKGLSTIIYEGATAPNIEGGYLENVTKSILTVKVLSTAAKESFEADSKWTASVNAVTVVPLAISEAADNSGVLDKHVTHTADVQVTRTIRHESYNALCLPFALSAGQASVVFGADCDIEELTGASISDGGIDLTFTKVSSMEAGKPYLVQPKATIANPSFTNVVITNETASSSLADVAFAGVFSPQAMTANENILLLGAENTLYPTGDGTLNGLRGYFVLKSAKASAAAKKSIRLVTNNGSSETALESITPAQSATKCIINRQLIIIHNGVQYNAQGARVR